MAIYQQELTAQQRKNIARNIFKTQAYKSIICGYFCIRFLDFILKGKGLLGYTICFLLTNTKRVIKYIKIFSIAKKVKVKKYIVLFVA